MIEAFHLFSVPLPQGTVMLSRLPGRSGDLENDLAAMVAAGVGTVISLTEQAEMADLGASALPLAAREAGLNWVHFAVPDFGVPTPDQDWRAVTTAVKQAFAVDKAVLVHCRGGLGRSGMAVLRLMVESGEDPDHALARLRRIRPGAVETEAQERWAMRR